MISREKREAAFSTQEAADYKGCSIITIKRAYKSGKLPGVNIGRELRFKQADLDALVIPLPGRPKRD